MRPTAGWGRCSQGDDQGQGRWSLSGGDGGRSWRRRQRVQSSREAKQQSQWHHQRWRSSGREGRYRGEESSSVDPHGEAVFRAVRSDGSGGWRDSRSECSNPEKGKALDLGTDSDRHPDSIVASCCWRVGGVGGRRVEVSQSRPLPSLLSDLQRPSFASYPQKCRRSSWARGS
jgi:hypothetical protein